MRKAIVIGLTGQTGAGKTTVAEGLRHFGYQVIKADEIARLVTEQGSPVLQELAAVFGAEDDSLGQAEHLFDDLRKADELGVTDIFVRCPSAEGVGLAVMNRLLRAAEFRIIEVD